MEPYSGHRLRHRQIPHSQLKEHLRHRYHIPPSLLYSVARPWPMRADGRAVNTFIHGDYEVPIDGDWIVIATIVEKSDLLVSKGFTMNAGDGNDPSSKGPTSSAADDDPLLFKDAGSDANGKLRLDLEPGNSDAFADASAKKSKPWQRRKAGDVELDDEYESRVANANLVNRSRKFVVLKLVDLGVNSTQGDGTGAAGRGDNYLSLVAYEADSIDTSVVHHNTNIRSEVTAAISATAAGTKKWINGSKGAFELLYKQAEGTLVAIMNPKVMRPYAPRGKGRDTESKMFRITPRCAEDCLIIGQAADYRRCSATKANGERCGSFVDIKARKQTGTSTCDFHLSRHMDSLARGRPEFAANSTSRFGNANGAPGSGVGPAASNSFSGRRGGGHAGDHDSAINKLSSKDEKHASNPFSRAALAKKLNSSFDNVGDGMDNNGGKVYVSQSPLVSALDADEEVRASDPSSWKYDISGRYGRGNTEKQGRLKKQIEEEQLMRKIEARFAPPPARPAKSQRDDADGDSGNEHDGPSKKKKPHEPKELAVLPNGTADMINAAYSTIDKRKQVAQQKAAAINAKKRKYTGVVDTSPATSESDSSKLKFMNLASTSAKRANTLLAGLPIAGLTRHSADADTANKSSSDSRSKLLSLAQNASASSASSSEPSLKLKRSHRPKLRLPTDEVGRVSKLKVLSGELVNLDDFEDDDWEDDLGDLKVPSAKTSEETEASGSLTDKIMQLRSQPHAEEDDSDLEII
uniref:Zinc finger Mcm10/DnaG-type domain-containing protein n=2 Tax=Kalmanozyma brasiliensis (strain GHG001) TaxID=1365824 RepID=V5GIR6_KALBG